METRIVIFLAFVSVAVIVNTLLIWFAYRGFARFTSKLTATVSAIGTSSETKAWLTTLQFVSEQAIAVTGTAKIKIAEFEPMLDRAQQQYMNALSHVDSKLEIIAGEITTNAQKVRDIVAKPAFYSVAFAAALSRVLETEIDE